MKSQGFIVTILAGVAVLLVFMFAKKPATTPTYVLGATSPNTTANNAAAAATLASSFAKFFQPSNAQHAIDASVGYVPNAPPLASGLGADENFTPTAPYTGPAFGPGLNTVNIMDNSIPQITYVDSDLLNSI